MTTIKLEIPSNDPSALFHMGEALRNIAKENGYIDRSETMSMEEMFEQIDEELATELQIPTSMLKGESNNASEEDKKAFSDVMNHGASLSDAEQYGKSLTDFDDVISDIEEDELLSPHVTVVEYEPATTIYPEIVTTTTSGELIDADDLPWDKRIHSRGKTRLADDTWRMARKPADKTDEEWAEFVDGVKAELKQLMDIPVATGEAGISIEDITQAETSPTLDELAVADLEQVEPQPIVLPPIKNPFEANPVVNSVTPPVITPPVTVTPPVVAPPVTVTPPTNSDVPNTFPLFMKWLTTNNKKLTSDMVNKVLNDNGVTAIPLLTSRADLIPQIHAELVKLL